MKGNFFYIILTALYLAACAPGTSGINPEQGTTTDIGVNSAPHGLLKVAMEAPLISTFILDEKTKTPLLQSRKIREVVIQFDKVKVLLKSKSKGAWVVLPGKEGHLGFGDNSLKVDFGSFEIPENVEVSRLQFELHDSGNYLVFDDGSRCEFKDVAARKAGLKFLFSEPVVIKSETTYEMKSHFDIEKSVVLTGNGECILKPVVHAYIREIENDCDHDMDREKDHDEDKDKDDDDDDNGGDKSKDNDDHDGGKDNGQGHDEDKDKDGDKGHGRGRGHHKICLPSPTMPPPTTTSPTTSTTIAPVDPVPAPTTTTPSVEPPAPTTTIAPADPLPTTTTTITPVEPPASTTTTTPPVVEPPPTPTTTTTPPVAEPPPTPTTTTTTLVDDYYTSIQSSQVYDFFNVIP